ncbi:MAG: ferrous iron transporter B, partial [Clostridia bacterium]|nr:ferrous iron transporter B [Clostridia bacterium]
MKEKNTIALAGNPNSGKTTLFNALTGSNQFVGNWPGVTVEKKEGKLKKHPEVTVVDLPGIYSLSPYTLEEVVARNYLIGERPDVILNIIDGTNLERNLYLTTQLTELGIPVVVAVNMIDIVNKNGDRIDTEKLSEKLGCSVVEISALKGTGTAAAAEAAISAANAEKPIPQHTFSGVVEHALAHIEEALLHDLPEENQRWYAIKVFERDEKVVNLLKTDADDLEHIERDIKAAEAELDDDSESIITNERYIYIAEILKLCYKKKNAGGITRSDKIDKVVTNRWLGLPIFAAIMFLVYFISMVWVGTPLTDWTNDKLFGDGFHLFGIGAAQYQEVSDEYTEAALIVDGYEAYIAENGAVTDGEFSYEVEDEETLEVTTETATVAEYNEALARINKIGDEPDPADYGIFVKSIPDYARTALDGIGAADWIKGLVIDGIIAGVGAVLGFVPQMLVLFFMLAFLEACGYMARIAFV